MIPLADRMRPKTLKDYTGQKHIVGKDKLLFKALLSGNLFSMILWGPPGVGKTTLARIIAQELQTDLTEFSAVTASIAEIKKLFESLRNQQNQALFQAPIIFIDEIHRFNKAQQDAFLPYVENGTIILIGATTENPSFEVIGPLLSRTRVLVLNPLSKEELVSIVNQALKDKINGLGEHKLKLSQDALELLIDLSGGDARVVLNTLEIAANMAVVDSGDNNRYSREDGNPINNDNSMDPRLRKDDKAVGSRRSLPRAESKGSNKKINITKELIEEAFQKKALMYDKAGEEHYNTISAFIKSMRASNVDAALYYLARMVAAGEDPLFIARRMVIFASEDIGMAQPTALVVANEVFRACETIGYPECQMNLAHGVTYLASAKKDRSSHDAYFEALNDVKTFGNLPIPLNLRNAPTKLVKEVGYGKGYEMYTDKDLLPEKLKGKKYYSPKKS